MFSKRTRGQISISSSAAAERTWRATRTERSLPFRVLAQPLRVLIRPVEVVSRFVKLVLSLTRGGRCFGQQLRDLLLTHGFERVRRIKRLLENWQRVAAGDHHAGR